MSWGRRARGALARARARSAERRFRRSRGATDRGAQVFILGLPRSGTTLVYQYLVHRLHVAYFTNAVGEHPYDPCRATWSQIKNGDVYRSDFESEYGRSRGDLAPREAGRFWLRFFDIDAYQAPGHVREAMLEEMREAVFCVQSIFGGAPFVNKNVKHLLRIPILNAAFPNPHFLVVERDRVDVALSILRGRVESLGSEEAWFSARPPEYQQLRSLDPIQQVAGQVAGLERKMNEDLALVSAARVHRIDYQAFCRSPDMVVAACGEVLRGVAEKNPAVASFELRRREPRTDLEARLAARVRAELPA